MCTTLSSPRVFIVYRIFSFALELQCEVTDGYILEVPIDHGHPRATMHELEWQSGRRDGMNLGCTDS